MPPVHREGDSRICGATTGVVGQSTVFANGRLIAVQNDPNSHGNGGLHASINSQGTKNIFIEGKLMVLQGSTANPDAQAHPNPPTTAATGSPDVNGR